MDRIARFAPSVVIALLVGACATGSAPPSVASPQPLPSVAASPSASAPTASASASASASPPASPTAFTSKTYGYSLIVPPGWSTVQAMLEWDGKGMPTHDVAEADQFVSPGPASSWLLRTPTKKDLAAQVKQAIAANAADHGDTCPPVPASQDAISVGGDPGVLLSWDCGILINVAVAVHDGKAYVFGFRDPSVHAATDPKDRATFLGLLESVTFPA